MKTEVIPVVVGALGTVNKGMVENIKKVSEIYCDRDPKDQAPVVQKMDSTIHRINHYPVDKY